MTESQELQSLSLLPKIPIRDFRPDQEHLILKPLLLQYRCSEAPFMSDIHPALPTFVLW